MAFIKRESKNKISVYCIWRNNLATINRTLAQLDDLEKLDYEFEYFFYENDSTDGTDKILKSWISPKKGKLCSEKLNVAQFGSTPNSERMELLSNCRNKCKSLNKLDNSNYTLLIDSDIKFSNANFNRQMKLLNMHKDTSMVCPNVRQNIPDLMLGNAQDSYYDLHAFLDIDGNFGNYFADCPFKKPIDVMNWKLGVPVKCRSSFGGFVLMHSSIFKECQWSTVRHQNGSGLCEHVKFCQTAVNYGSILIDPLSKVYTNVNLSTVNLSACKEIAISQL